MGLLDLLKLLYELEVCLVIESSGQLSSDGVRIWEFATSQALSTLVQLAA